MQHDEHDPGRPVPDAASTYQPSGQEAQDVDEGGLSPLLVILLITGVLGLLASGVLVLNEGGGASGGNASEGSAQAQIATPVPPRPVGNWQADDFELVAVTGDTIRLSQFRGRPVFLNFWWTGCPPCVREFPAFSAFMAEQGANGAVVLAVNQGEDAAEIRSFLDSVGVHNVPVLLDPEMTLREDYPYNAFPTTYFIDPEGQVVYQKFGEITLDEMFSYLEDTAAG
ncbi:MAG: TlpA family protein disulfide reductase [Chloroflexota bacterium]